MSKELKCCPFCGGKAEIRHNVLWYWVQCKICGVHSKDSANKDMVIEQWNTRKPIDRIVEELERLDNMTFSRALNENGVFYVPLFEVRENISESLDIVRKGGWNEKETSSSENDNNTIKL